ncbi:unnamed protein product [Bursaphelenchus xylophilus]|uniref:(pine wood nematode) hypothetical protein n=1 Tax=Bursaphelenchus xylophilus TaxID=6326 RepID=A0A7I8X7I7_BURXY|nr:unnamed protein product [Bursaphelenchus xylophilus]CAG9126574.1 unnamed protein product [Bursaphelenchus xylophilus]
MEQKPSTGMPMKTIQTDFGRTIPTFSRKKSSKLSAMKTKYTQQKPIDPVESDEILRTEYDTSDFEDQIEASLNVELGFSDDQVADGTTQLTLWNPTRSCARKTTHQILRTKLASLNVELGFSDDQVADGTTQLTLDDQENPSEEAEEPSSSLENDVNKLIRNQPKDTASPEHPMVPVRQLPLQPVVPFNII